MYTKRMKIRAVGGNTVMTIPRDLVRLARLTQGISLDIHCSGEKIVIDLTSAQRSKLFDPPAAISPAKAVEAA
jgi:antitoxin component of MazEF toxin-antitoxin module